jgi:hypothetical protein
MEILFFALFVIYSLITALWVANLAESKGIEFLNAFLVSFFLGPIIGLLYVVVKSLDSNCSCK